MKSLFSFLKSRQKEINLLRKENKLLKEAVLPLTSLGIPIEKLADVLKPFAVFLKSEIERLRHEASYRSPGRSSSSPITSPRTNYRW
jgi:hypothetical protein